jgi:hypothetical protein
MDPSSLPDYPPVESDYGANYRKNPYRVKPFFPRVGKEKAGVSNDWENPAHGSDN